MEWTKYFNKDILIIDSSSYLNNINLKNKKNYLEVLKNNEEQFNKNLEDIKILTEKKIDIDEYKKKNSLVLLEHQKNIISILNKYCMKLNNLDFDFIVNVLKHLNEVSNILKTRLNQKDIKYHNKDNIQRCSYKFCKFKENCSYNYNNKKNICYQDHYVHNMVICDLKQIINFLEKHKDGSSLNDFSKSINTISFVINHMYKELNTRCLYHKTDKDIEKEHISKSK